MIHHLSCDKYISVFSENYIVGRKQKSEKSLFLCRSLMESKLKSGTTIIVDRYSYSGVAFSSAKGLDFDWCKVKTCLVV